jgi:hypothetical protein
MEDTQNNPHPVVQNASPTRIVKIFSLAFVSFIILTIPLSKVLPPGIDWHLAFRPAALAVLEGQSPYSIEGFFNAPWTVIFFLPFAFFSEEIGRAGLFIIGLASYGWVAYRLGAKPIAFIAFLLSPPVLHGLLNSNIDWLALLGFILPPQVGLFFVIIKPQVGIGIMIYWFYESWKAGGWREITRVFLPFSMAILGSFLIFGLWPLRFSQEIGLWWNASLWPLSIPVGLVLLVYAFRTRNIRYALPAGPCLSPYVLLHSWAGALLPLVTLQSETLIAVAGLWLVVILRA